MANGRSSRSSTWTKGAAISDQLRLEVTRRGNELLARKFEPLLAHEIGMRKHVFNYAVAVFSEWRGQSYYLCARYRTPRPTEEFVVRNTRLEYVGRGRFHLAYFRHTDRWQLVYHGLTLDECSEAIEQEEIFWPLT
jgi:hypothetical protein